MGAGAQVLVVGAGPSGLLAAVELARHGVAVRLVEREPEPHREARATAIQPGTLEILAQAGVAGRFLGAAERVKAARVLDEELRPLSESSFAGTGGHSDIQCSLPQWRTEQLLADRLAELGGKVERGVSVVSLEAGDDGVLAGLEHADGRTEVAEGVAGRGAGRADLLRPGAGRRGGGLLRPAARHLGADRHGPAPGDRYPDRVTLPGPRHHLLLYGPPAGGGADDLGRRWRGLVDVIQA
ncbi:MAG: FAD-dependent monooxygenase, partial [Streptosporangiaceae bacterium]